MSEPSAAELRAALFNALRDWVRTQQTLLPQRVIAEKLHIPRSMVSDIMRGESRFTVEKLAELWVAAGNRWELRLHLPGDQPLKVSTTNR